ncbi:hypothetical protein ACTFIY_006388 [Dictyostelium cf. discoideum]
MPSVTVDYKVFMTHDHTNNTSIGTDGLATCIGIIARLNNGDTYCGHISNEIQGSAPNIPIIMEKTQAIMTERLNPANVISVYCATTSTFPDTNAMYNAIVNTYPDLVQPKMQGTGIYWDGNAVGVINGLYDNINGNTEGTNNDQGPLNVTN